MTENISFNFEKLTVYQKSLDAADWVYESTTTFPKNEIYGVTSQFRRAVVSIALNIAEGSARSKKDFRRLLDIAQGSVLECVALRNLCSCVGSGHLVEPPVNPSATTIRHYSGMATYRSSRHHG